MLDRTLLVGRYAHAHESGVIVTAEINADETGYSLFWTNGPRQRWQLCLEESEVSANHLGLSINFTLLDDNGITTWFLLLISCCEKSPLEGVAALSSKSRRCSEPYMMRLSYTLLCPQLDEGNGSEQINSLVYMGSRSVEELSTLNSAGGTRHL